MHCHASLLTACLLALSGPPLSAEDQGVRDLDRELAPVRLFPRQGNRFFRIPGLAVTPKGTLLAFAGERKGSVGDFGHDSDVVLRRSADGGATWSEPETILSAEGIDFHSGPVVVDRRTGAVFKFARSHGAKTKPGTDWRDNHVLRSDDDGRTWTRAVLPLRHARAGSRFGPGNGGHGIQLADGRLVVHGGYLRSPGGKKSMSLCLIESRDGGKTWQVMAGSDVDDAHVEFCMAEPAPGRIYLNVRELDGPERCFGVLDGKTPPRLGRAAGLHGARCRAGMVAVRRGGQVHLFFTGPTGPAKRARYDEAARIDLTLFRSDAEGKRWERAALIHRGKAAYSDLAALPGGDLACVYETGNTRPDEEIRFVRIPAID
jgi:sialidase-1